MDGQIKLQNNKSGSRQCHGIRVYMENTNQWKRKLKLIKNYKQCCSS